MRILIFMLASLAACIPENSPIMRPGEECLSCHARPDNARKWTVAGTVFASLDSDANLGKRDVRVFVTDRNGRQLILHSNAAGNFYTAERIAFPVTVAVEQSSGGLAQMDRPAESGDCNDCHNQPAREGAPGRIFASD